MTMMMKTKCGASEGSETMEILNGKILCTLSTSQRAPPSHDHQDRKPAVTQKTLVRKYPEYVQRLQRTLYDARISAEDVDNLARGARAQARERGYIS
jgi:hypothetical protein